MSESPRQYGGLRKRTKPFTATPNSTIDDFTISYRALGILVKVLRLPDGWDVRADQIAGEGKHNPDPDKKSEREGREAVRTALRELARAGYYRLERIRLCQGDRAGQFVMSTAISEDRVESWAEQAKVFDGKAVPLYEQPDGTLLVKYPDGTMAPDDFPVPDQIANRANPEDGFSGDGSPEPRKATTGEPSPADASPFKEGLQKSDYKDSEPPTEVRPDSRNLNGSPVQAALVGDDQPLAPREPTYHDQAMGIAGKWMAEWKDRSEGHRDIAGRNVKHRIKSAVQQFLEARHEVWEVQHAMVWAAAGIPTSRELEDGLAQVAKGWRAPKDWKPGDRSVRYQNGAHGKRANGQGVGPMAGTNLHIDDISAEARAARNPFTLVAEARAAARSEGANA